MVRGIRTERSRLLCLDIDWLFNDLTNPENGEVIWVLGEQKDVKLTADRRILGTAGPRVLVESEGVGAIYCRNAYELESALIDFDVVED